MARGTLATVVGAVRVVTLWSIPPAGEPARDAAGGGATADVARDGRPPVWPDVAPEKLDIGPVLRANRDAVDIVVGADAGGPRLAPRWRPRQLPGVPGDLLRAFLAGQRDRGRRLRPGGLSITRTIVESHTVGVGIGAESVLGAGGTSSVALPLRSSSGFRRTG
jgi:hypothetical protein